MIILLESPYLHEHPIDGEEYSIYLSRCLRDSLKRGEAPIATHAMYTRPGVLNLSIGEATLATLASDDLAELIPITVAYTDYGITEKMDLGLDRAGRWKHTIEYREIGKNTREDYAGNY